MTGRMPADGSALVGVASGGHTDVGLLQQILEGLGSCRDVGGFRGHDWQADGTKVPGDCSACIARTGAAYNINDVNAW